MTALRGVLLVLAVLSCSVRADIQVRDSLNRNVTLGQPAQRIVALAPHIVENIFSAGAGEKLVGVVNYSNYPEAARSLPQLGSAYAWSLETLISMQPDLVVLWGSGNGINSLARLEEMGMHVYVSEPRQLADISDSIRDIGALAGTPAVANAEADKFDTEIAALRARYQHTQAISALYQVWNSPLQTINGEHMISQVMRLCGGRNVFAELSQLAPQISLESVLDRDPDAIVASGMDKSRPEWLDDWRQYSALTAVRNNALLHIHPDLIQRPTTRIAAGARSMCEQLDAVRGQPPL